MKDEIIIRTLIDTEIGVLEEFVKKVEDSPKILEDDKFVSRANFDILKGHLGTLKKLRETSWRAIKMDETHDRNHTTITLSNGEQVYIDVPKDIVGVENIVKERDNWREMYDEELKKNEELKKENDELSRINSIRIGDINRLQNKIDVLEIQIKLLKDDID